jgi:peptidyl-prolyl cis-trans isomerase B (cyclophilin B)
MITFQSAPALRIDPYQSYVATFQLARGSVDFELFSKDVTRLVNNFIFLALNSFYNGTRFHRVVEGVLIQGGDPQGSGEGGPGYVLRDELRSYTHSLGTLSMANCGPNTNGSQFFITLQDSPWLDSCYSIIGRARSNIAALSQIQEGDELQRIHVTAPVHGKLRRISWADIVENWERVENDAKRAKR